MNTPNPFRLSSAQRIALCPGSVEACKPLMGQDNSSPEAERGTRIHAALAEHYAQPVEQQKEQEQADE